MRLKKLSELGERQKKLLSVRGSKLKRQNAPELRLKHKLKGSVLKLKKQKD